MNNSPWTRWHEVLTLRDDIKNGDLSLALFAADLYEVVTKTAAPIYQDPADFFAASYITENMGHLARDVMQRLAGTGSRAVRQLERTYGGGKTHAMTTLYHLANQPDELPGDLPALRELRQYSGLERFPQAQIAVLPFDKIDVESGLDTPSPVTGEPIRRLRNPWSILAYQLAGAEGLRVIHPQGEDAERESAPAEPGLAALIALARREKPSVLILVDEVLMYARGKIDIDPGWGIQLINFFQSLTEAVAHPTARAALVVSLLANDPARNDAIGRQYAQDLAQVISRIRDEDVLPIAHADVAPVLRRRFFTTVSLQQDYRSHVLAALVGVKDWDEATDREGAAAIRRYTESYPFHPDLTEVFFQKWTQIDTFQYARGVLRTFALALRDAAARNDPSPLVGANIFLGPDDTPAADLPAATQELAGVAALANIDGIKVNWNAILGGELQRARDLQVQSPALQYREMEQAVIAVFLHSQPEGKKASLRDLLLLLSPTRPDKIETRRALRRWTEVSWFLDEQETATAAPAAPGGDVPLPESWRFGFQPNLNQLHDQKKRDIVPETVEAELEALLLADKSLTNSVNASGARASKVTKFPSDLDDNGSFQFGIPGPKAASTRARPSPEAQRFLREKTGPDAPRSHKNMVVLVVPDSALLETLREKIREWKAWQEVRDSVTLADLSDEQRRKLDANLRDTQRALPAALRQAYSLAVAYTKDGDIEALPITDDNVSLFSSLKNSFKAAGGRMVVLDSPISPDAFLEDGAYPVLRDGEQSRSVKSIIDTFTQQPRMPKMLNRQSLLDTVSEGCRQGFYALRWLSIDGSPETIWRESPGQGVLDNFDKTASLEVVLPQAATLTRLTPALLAPGRLPALWPAPEGTADDPARLTLAELRHYFRGGHIVTPPAPDGGHVDPIAIPQVDPAKLDQAVRDAVLAGHIAVVTGPTTFFKEQIPEGLLTDTAVLIDKPQDLNVNDLLPAALPEAWNGQTEVTANALRQALSAHRPFPLPWSTLSHALSGALRARLLQTTPSSVAWPADATQAAHVRLSLIEASGVREGTGSTTTQPVYTTRPATHAATAEVTSGQIQDLADSLPALMQAAAGCGLTFHLTVEMGRDSAPDDETLEKVSQILSTISADLSL